MESNAKNAIKAIKLLCKTSLFLCFMAYPVIGELLHKLLAS